MWKKKMKVTEIWKASNDEARAQVFGTLKKFENIDKFYDSREEFERYIFLSHTDDDYFYKTFENTLDSIINDLFERLKTDKKRKDFEQTYQYGSYVFSKLYWVGVSEEDKALFKKIYEERKPGFPMLSWNADRDMRFFFKESWPSEQTPSPGSDSQTQRQPSDSDANAAPLNAGPH